MLDHDKNILDSRKSFPKSFRKYLAKSNLGIFKKFLFSFLIISILPLFIFATYTFLKISTVNEEIINKVTLNIDQKTQETMELQAVITAEAVRKFLRQRENDLFILKELKFEPNIFLQFSSQSKSEIWFRMGTNENFTESRTLIPIYKEISFINENGYEKIKIKNNKIVNTAELKNVKNPRNTTYLIEDYFEKTSILKEGELYVSHLNGFFVNKKEQLGNANTPEEAVEGKYYDGVIRFATPIFKAKKFSGILMFGVDHRHFMEFTQHILPNRKDYSVFPIYSSGDYAFMFDDRGWIITHPKLWDIPGVDSSGKLVPAYTKNSSKEDINDGRIPFNLDSVGFIDDGYPFVAEQVRNKKSGSVITTNVGGVKKVMSYTPIPYNKGEYKKYGIFGGITVGSNIERFHTAANSISNDMNQSVLFFRNNILWIIFITVLFALFTSWFLSRNFTKPILSIISGARRIAQGNLSQPVIINRNDEVGYLANSFNYMTEEIKRKNKALLSTFEDLKKSKSEIENYANDLEYQLKIFKSILRISNTLGSTFDLSRILKYILHNTVSNLGFDRAILYLIDKNGKYLVCREVFGFNEKEEILARSSKYNIAQFNCIETKVVKEGKVIFVDDINTFSEATELDKKIRKISGSKSFVFVPLIVKEKIIGVLGADKLITKTKISEIDVTSLRILANQASRVIENTRLVQEIIHQKNLNEDILNFMPNGVISVTKIGEIISLNPEAKAILGNTTSNLIGKNLWDLFNYNKMIVDEINNVLTNKGFYSSYNQILKINSNEKFLTVLVSMMGQAEGGSSGLIVIIQDTTEKKILDDQIQRMERLASLGKFAAGIAHEIRNPLTGISLFLDDLHDKIPKNPKISKNIELGLKEVERLERLINELLDYASPSKHVNSLININDLIESTLGFIEKRDIVSGISIVKDFSQIPLIELDPEKIRQALLNIFLNAVQVMNNNGKIFVETKLINDNENLDIDVKQKTAWVKIVVTDTGPGIPNDILNKVFDPFVTNRKKGTGLGLSITHSIIAEHKGKISVTNVKQGGAKFIISLPLIEKKYVSAGVIK